MPQPDNGCSGSIVNDNIQSKTGPTSGRSEVDDTHEQAVHSKEGNGLDLNNCYSLDSTLYKSKRRVQITTCKIILLGEDQDVLRNAGGGKRQSCGPIPEVEEGGRMATATELRPRTQQLQQLAKNLQHPVPNTNSSGPTSPEKPKHVVSQSERPESNPESQSAIIPLLKSGVVKSESCNEPRRQSAIPGEIGDPENFVNHTQRDR